MDKPDFYLMKEIKTLFPKFTMSVLSPEEFKRNNTDEVKNQENSHFFVQFGFEPVTQKIVSLYQPEDDQVNLEGKFIQNKRENLQVFKKHNYKKFFYKESKARNTDLHKIFIDSIKQTLKKHVAND